MWKLAKRWLYFFHRWLGVVTCLLSVMWFVSGLVMLYVPFPSWSDAERIASLPPVDISRVGIMPDEAMARAGISAMPSTFRLEMLADEPVYRIVAGDKRASISASTGNLVAGVSADDAKRHVAAAFPGSHPELLEEIDYNQWTVTRRFDPHRPILKFALDDPYGTNVYVSSRTGEIVQNAIRSERVWNWLGAIPHWIYFSPIRKDQELWRQSVMWLSGPLIIGAVAGVWIGILRLRVRKPYAKGRMTPYRGWMKCHHVGGLVGGLFLTTWIASGWLSVNPFKWFARTQLSETQLGAYTGWSKDKPYGVTREALAALSSAEPSDISFAWVGGRPLIVARSRTGEALADAQTGMPIRLEDAALVEAARHVFPSVPVVDAYRLSEETFYWYSHHNRRPLPVVKVSFGDPSATWLYLDPATGAIAGLSDRSSRTYRWLFNFIHDYDLPLLLRNQPARDILVWVLSIAGLVVSVSGVVIGWRTLLRRVA